MAILPHSVVRYIGQRDFVLERDLDANIKKQTPAARNSDGRYGESDHEDGYPASGRVVFRHVDARGLCFFSYAHHVLLTVFDT